MFNRDSDDPGYDDAQTGWRRFVPSKRAVGIAALVLLLIFGGIAWWSYSKFRSIERVDLAGVLASGNGTNYLIVGSDTREGLSSDDPNAGAFLGDDAAAGGPERSDTILILRIDSQGTHTLSVPRDLLVTIADTGQQTRINAAFNGGPERLIKTLDQELGLPIHHYLQIDFVSFAGLVDALGGITVNFQNPAFDKNSGLNVPEAGPQKLDGAQALAYVRSRQYTEIVDGREVTDPTADIGRVVRQQAFLAAVGDAVQETRSPFKLAKVADSLAEGMMIDSDLGYFEAIKLFLKMRGINPEPNSLPTTPIRTSAGAAVLSLVQPDADEILARFGSEGSQIG